MSVLISVKTTLDQWRAQMTTVQREQIPFAAAVALNDCAEIAQLNIRDDEKRVFDRPTPYTLDSTYVRRASKQNLQASIEIKDEAFKANPAAKWLAPEVFGGDRPMKKFELALKRIGIVPSGLYCVPGSAATLDAYGNMSRGQIVQIMSWFQAFGQQGYSANMTAATKARRTRTTARKYGVAYFALLSKRGKLRPGIYQRVELAHGSAVRPVIEFVRAPVYRPRLSFYQQVERTVNERFPERFARAVQAALATAK